MGIKFKHSLLFVILCLLGNVSAQNYLPLEIGNRWDFRNYYNNGNNVQEKEASTIIVKMDSTMPNGKTYFFLDGQGAYISGWVRTDTNWLFRYNASDSTEYPFLNFDLQFGDTLRNEKIIGFITLARKDTIRLFNKYSTRLVFDHQLGFDNIMSLSFSNKYGFLGESYYYFGTIDYSQLSGCIIGDSTYGTILSVGKSFSNDIRGYSLFQNYPNPFNPSTNISFSIPEGQLVELNIYDLLGRKLMSLLNEYRHSGKHDIKFNNSNLASGVYFYQLKAGKFIQTKKLIILK